MLTEIFSRCFAGTGSVNSTDTWRNEFKSRTFAPCHYFSLLPRDVSAHASRVQKNFSKSRYSLENNVPYSLFENTFIFVSNEILEYRIEIRIGTV
jgi:hypothetical protein